jgi:hypothetical protein
MTYTILGTCNRLQFRVHAEANANAVPGIDGNGGHNDLRGLFFTE